MTGITPHITFQGNCEEVLNYYQEKFSGEISKLNRYKGSPVEVPEDYQNKIMHAEFRFGSNMFIAADMMPGAEYIHGNNIQFSVDCKGIDEAKQYFDSLAQDGKVLMEMQETFWGALFGMLEDKYGFQWMFNIEIQK